LLQILDTLWKEHLANMDHLRRGIHLRGYAQKNPKQEYKRESFNLFQSMLTNLKQDVVRVLSHVQVQRPEDVDAMEQRRREQLEHQMAVAQAHHEGDAEPSESASEAAAAAPFV